MQYPDLAVEQCEQAVKTLDFRSIDVGDSVAGVELAVAQGALKIIDRKATEYPPCS